MNNEAAVPATPQALPKKGKLSWVVPVLDLLSYVIYFILAWKAIERFLSNFDIAGFFGDIQSAIIFFLVATVVTTIMCFIPVFKSKGNTRLAVWNIVWLAINLSGWLFD